MAQSTSATPANLLPGHIDNLSTSQRSSLHNVWRILLHIFDISKDKSAQKDATVTSSLAQPDAQKLIKSFSAEEWRRLFWRSIKTHHPDVLLLCFLRARNFDVHKSTIMFLRMLRWRQDIALDDEIMRLGEAGAAGLEKKGTAQEKAEAEGFLKQLRLGKSLFHGVDLAGRPMVFIRAGLHRKADQTQSSLERYTIYNIEMGRLLVRDPVDTATMIFDMSDFGLSNMDQAPLKFMTAVFEANYPETLGLMVIHKAPWVFKGIWAVVKGWLDPVVASKIVFTSTAAELSKFVAMDKIPGRMGGTEKWDYHYVEPREGENESMRQAGNRETSLETQQVITDKLEQATLDMLAGKENSEQERNALAKELADNYWALDPYIRARSLYDRLGILRSSGPVDFYVDSANALS